MGYAPVGPSSNAGASVSRAQPFAIDLTLYDQTLGAPRDGAVERLRAPRVPRLRAQNTAGCAPQTGGGCQGLSCNGDIAIDCPTRTFGDSVDCSLLPGGTCAQLPNAGPVFCAPKDGASCAGTLPFFTSCDGTQLVVCAHNLESRVDCVGLGFTSCVNGGPAGTCQ